MSLTWMEMIDMGYAPSETRDTVPDNATLK